MRVGEFYLFDELGIVFYPAIIQLKKYVKEDDSYLVRCQWFKDEKNPKQNPDFTVIDRQEIIDHYIKAS